jgi:hypothetical protein
MMETGSKGNQQIFHYDGDWLLPQMDLCSLPLSHTKTTFCIQEKLMGFVSSLKWRIWYVKIISNSHNYEKYKHISTLMLERFKEVIT